MARNGPGDFHNQPTQHADYRGGGRPPPGEPPDPAPPPTPTDQFEQPGIADSLDQESEPTPWYRRPVMLIGWVVLVVVLVALIIYGILQLANGNQGGSRTPTTSTTPSATTTTMAPTTTTPPTSSAVEPAPQQPTYQPTQQQPAQQQPTQQQPTHQHHLPHLPPVITIPQVPTVITLPPGLH